MKHWLYIALLLSLAAALPAQTTLSFGEISLGPTTTPPTYIVNVVMAGSNNTVAGLQFDLNYTPSQFTVATIGLGAAATAASKEISTTPLPAAFNPNLNNPSAPNGPGQRAIIIGAGLNDQTVSTTAGPAIIADGVVATLTVQPAAGAGTQTLTLLNIMGTTAGGLNVAAQSVSMTIGAGSNDAGATGIVDTSKLVPVGQVYPSTSDAVGHFGSGGLQLNDLLTELFAVTKLTVTGYPVPACGTDRFDALDTYPQDTANARGGLRNGTLTLNDLLTELFMVTKLPGYTTIPARVSLPYVCAAGQRTTPETAMSGRAAAPRILPVVEATLVFGRPESAGGQDRVPVYLEAQRNFNRLGIAFGVGDQQSQLQFDSSSGVSPSLLQDSTAGMNGVIGVAWLRGIDLRMGQRQLLGYVVGPAGSAANLKVFGLSASLVDSLQEVGLDVSGAALAQQ